MLRCLVARAASRQLCVGFAAAQGLTKRHEALDITLQVPITLADRMQTRTVQRVLKFERRVQCSECQGKGFVLNGHSDSHSRSHGEGEGEGEGEGDSEGHDNDGHRTVCVCLHAGRI